MARDGMLPEAFHKVDPRTLTPVRNTVLSVAACLYLIYGLPYTTFLLFAGWLALALVAYWCYGRRHSHLAESMGPAPTHPVEQSRGAS